MLTSIQNKRLIHTYKKPQQTLKSALIDFIRNFELNSFITINSNNSYGKDADIKSAIDKILGQTICSTMRNQLCKQQFVAFVFYEKTGNDSLHVHILLYIPDNIENFLKAIKKRTKRILKTRSCKPSIKTKPISDKDNLIDYVTKDLYNNNYGDNFKIYKAKPKSK